MFFVSEIGILGNNAIDPDRVYVTDTRDWVKERYTFAEVLEIAKEIPIQGVSVEEESVELYKFDKEIRKRESADRLFGVESKYECVAIDKGGTSRVCLKLIQVKFIDETTVGKYLVMVGTVAIESYAFTNCKNPFHVKLPITCTTLENHSFDSSNIMSINLENVESIGESAFESCVLLRRVTLSDKVKSLPKLAFSNSGLSYANLGGTSSIEVRCFGGCDLLETIILNNTVSCGDSAFAECKKLVNIDTTKISNMGMKAFSKTGLQKVDISNCISIKSEVFSDCSELKEVIWSNSVDFAPAKLFIRCSQLTKISNISGCITGVTGTTRSFDSRNFNLKEVIVTSQGYIDGVRNFMREHAEFFSGLVPDEELRRFEIVLEENCPEGVRLTLKD